MHLKDLQALPQPGGKVCGAGEEDSVAYVNFMTLSRTRADRLACSHKSVSYLRTLPGIFAACKRPWSGLGGRHRKHTWLSSA